MHHFTPETKQQSKQRVGAGGGVAPKEISQHHSQEIDRLANNVLKVRTVETSILFARLGYL